MAAKSNPIEQPKPLNGFEARKGKGRPKGSKNIVGVEAKQAFAQAFDEMGGVANLVAWARKSPETFYKLYSKLIPVTVNGTDPSGAIRIIISDAESKL